MTNQKGKDKWISEKNNFIRMKISGWSVSEAVNEIEKESLLEEEVAQRVRSMGFAAGTVKEIVVVEFLIFIGDQHLNAFTSVLPKLLQDTLKCS